MKSLTKLLILLIFITSCSGKEYYEIKSFEHIPLTKQAKKVQLLGLGEATHGTLEFATIKSSIVKDLVVNHGYDLLAIEANYLDAKKVNTWLNGGEGHIDELIKGLKYWTFNNVSFKSLLIWIKKYNEKSDRPIHLCGIDMQFVQQSIREPFAYLKNYLSEDSLVFNYLQELDTLSLEQLGNRFYNTSLREFQEIKKCINKAQQIIRIHQSKKIIADSTIFWHQYNLDNVIHALEMYENDVYFYGTSEYVDVRDLSMAENSIKIVEQYNNSKMILWTHNYHVKKHSSLMGGILKDSLGNNFSSFCLTTRKGYLTAYSETDSLNQLSTFMLDESYSESLEYKIWSSDLPNKFMMHTRDLINRLDIKDSLLMLDVGAVYHTDSQMNNYTRTQLEKEYDYIIYIDSTNALN